jgi:phage shock protein A
MGIFQRTTEIVSANLNDFVDRFEQPERMLRHALREMEELVATTSSAVARSLAAERLLNKTRNEHRQQVEAWSGRAKKALALGDEVLARRAVARQLTHQQSLDSLEEQLLAAKETNAGLRRQLDQLRDKYTSAQTRLATLLASQSAADARRRVYNSTSGALGSSRAIARFEHFCRKLELAEAETSAHIELATLGEDFLEQEIAERAWESAIDQELALLKEG